MISNFVASALIGTGTGAAIVVAQAPALAPDSHVTLAIAAAAVVFSGGLVYRLGQKIQRLEDGQVQRTEQIAELRGLVKALPCQRQGWCKEEDSRH